MKHFFPKIYFNKPISKDFYLIVFDWNYDESAPLPGQFLTIRVSENSVPLIRRPFAFSGYDKNKHRASIIYQKRGPATEILAGKKPKEALDIIGPIGNVFKIDRITETYIIIAGGIGLGPMIYLANYLKDIGKRVIFIFGARNKSFIPQKNIFGSIMPVICTDDGSEGFKGTTIDYLISLNGSNIKNTTIIACGPLLMLKGCHEYAQNHNLQCLVSMEQVMACGVGACMGCAIKIVQEPGYVRVCSEGPVFNSGDIVWS